MVGVVMSLFHHNRPVTQDTVSALFRTLVWSAQLNAAPNVGMTRMPPRKGSQ